jgi:transcription-repair coupling factor (superfamily II helicase)
VREVATDGGSIHVACRPAPTYAGDVRRLADDLRPATSTTVVLLGNTGRADRLADVLREDGLAVGESSRILIRVGVLSRGFEIPEAALAVLADGDVFPEEVHLHSRGKRRGLRSFLSDFRDLKTGDLVVHEEHGIGRFLGLETLQVGSATREFMVLGYQAGDKLKVPVESFDRIQKYASAEGARPAVDRLGSGTWEKTKTRVKKAMRDMAQELLRLYAARKARAGHAFSGESPWQREFEEAFEYEETPDQAQAIVEVAGDMASPKPMDRLVCGDVGYGKTEVAMRAAMRAVLDGKQVASSPTTVLAFQHWKTFRKRFAPFQCGRDDLPLPPPRRRSRPSSPALPPAGWTCSSAPTGSSRRTSSSATSASWWWTRSSASGSRPRRSSSTSRRPSTASPSPRPPSRARSRWASAASATCRSSRPRPAIASPSRPRS